MSRLSPFKWYGSILLAALVGSGCLERTETIRVARDGAVSISVEYSGEAQDFETPDFLPSEAGGWPVQSVREPNAKGDGEKIILRAERRFAPREELPSSFAPTSDPQADLGLQFPTTLQHERRSDGVYLHFRRTYQARPWAYIDYWRQKGIDDEVRKLAEKPQDELTHEEKLRMIKAFADFEFLKQLEIARAAVNALDAKVSQDHWLLARRALRDVAESVDWNGLVEQSAELSEELRNDLFERESQRILAATRQAFLDELCRVSLCDSSRREKIDQSWDRAAKRFAITESLGGHAFQIRIYMPGEIVATNADKVEDDGAAYWEFDGSAMRDRTYELLVTSKMAADRPGH